MQMISAIKKMNYWSEKNVFKLLFLFILFGILTSCNNSPNQNPSTQETSDAIIDSTNSQASTTSTNNNTISIDPRLDVLYMEKTQFEKICPNPGTSKKWVLKHSITDLKLNDFTLSVWPETGRRFQSDTLNLHNWIESKIDLGEPAIFGDQKLTNQQVKDIRNAFTTGGHNYIIFLPKKGPKPYEGKNYEVIYYEIHLVVNLDDFETEYKKQTFTLAAFTSSNPSPPANALD